MPKQKLGMWGSLILMVICLFLYQDAYVQGANARMVIALILSLYFLSLAINAFVMRRRWAKESDQEMNSPQIRIAENPNLEEPPVGIA